MVATREIGSSTAVLAKLDTDILKTTNLGDSGYVLYSFNKEGLDVSKIPYAADVKKHSSDDFNYSGPLYF